VPEQYYYLATLLDEEMSEKEISLLFEKPVAKLQDLYEGNWNNPLGLHRAVLEYRKKQAKELVGLQVFTLDKLLAVYVQAALKEEE